MHRLSAAIADPLSKFKIHDLIPALCSILQTCIAYPGNSFKSRLGNSGMACFQHVSVALKNEALAERGESLFGCL